MRCEVEFYAELVNNVQFFDVENQFTALHSLENKQNLGHNFRAPAHTGDLVVNYLDFPAGLTFAFVEQGNLFLSDVVAPILSFFQRGRIFFGIARFTM
jgi:hypothetical protein